MNTERVLHLLELEKLYALKQRGFQQKPINKEVAEALDIAIESVITVQKLERYIEMKGRERKENR